MPKILKVGAEAPQFSLSDHAGKRYSLSEISAPWVVLYFYPKDDTPGCTIEAQEFSRLLADFTKKKAVVLGISGGDARSKERFCAKYGLTVPLLSDKDFKVSAQFGAYGKKSFMGRSFLGILRTTYILDAKRRVQQVFEKVSAAGHAAEVLAAIGGTAPQAAPARGSPQGEKRGAPQREKHSTSKRRPSKSASKPRQQSRASKGKRAPKRAAR